VATVGETRDLGWRLGDQVVMIERIHSGNICPVIQHGHKLLRVDAVRHAIDTGCVTGEDSLLHQSVQLNVQGVRIAASHVGQLCDAEQRFSVLFSL